MSDSEYFDYSLAPDQCRKGYIGEGGSKRGKMEDAERNLDRLRGQRLPYAIFFGHFLAWLQESDTADV